MFIYIYSETEETLSLPRSSVHHGIGRRVTLYARCNPLLDHTQAHHKILLTGSTLRGCLSHCPYPLRNFSLLIVKNIPIFDSNTWPACSHMCWWQHVLSFASSPSLAPSTPISVSTWIICITTRLRLPWLVTPSSSASFYKLLSSPSSPDPCPSPICFKRFFKKYTFLNKRGKDFEVIFEITLVLWSCFVSQKATTKVTEKGREAVMPHDVQEVAGKGKRKALDWHWR